MERKYILGMILIVILILAGIFAYFSLNGTFSSPTITTPENYTVTNQGNNKISITNGETNYTVQEIETIDTSNPEVQKAIAMYNLGQQYKIKVVSDEVAASKDYVTNMIQNAAGVLLTVDTSKVAAAEYTYITSDSSWENPEVERENYLKQVSDKMVSLVEVNDVNISSSVYLDEIANHKRVTEAQATYESEMGKINKKETRLDNQLNQLETERTAIKTEQDSVKNVVKENVDLAFKLFS